MQYDSSPGKPEILGLEWWMEVCALHLGVIIFYHVGLGRGYLGLCKASSAWAAGVL